MDDHLALFTPASQPSTSSTLSTRSGTRPTTCPKLLGRKPGGCRPRGHGLAGPTKVAITPHHPLIARSTA